jgi:hypothetical protein
MPTEWENSYVDRLRTLYDHKGQVQKIATEIRQAVEPLSLPDAAKVLTAIATDLMAAVQTRNNRADVNDACGALRTAIALLEAVDPNLDG